MRLRLFHYRVHAVCEVTLSRRNLLALLQKLEMSGSARTLVSDDCPAGLELVVRAEDDDEHYRRRDLPPGPMHPRTESFIRACGALPGEFEAGDADLDAQEVPEGVIRPTPGEVDRRLLEQDQVWFDRFGRMHRIDQMPLEYLLNVLSFLERVAAWGPSLSERLEASGEEIDELDRSDLIERNSREDCVAHLRAKPLMRALGQAANARLSDVPDQEACDD